MRRDCTEEAYRQLRLWPKNTERWKSIIAETLEELPEDKARAVRMRYFEHRTTAEVLESLPVSRTSWIAWRDEAVATLIAKAARERLLRP